MKTSFIVYSLTDTKTGKGYLCRGVRRLMEKAKVLNLKLPIMRNGRVDNDALLRLEEKGIPIRTHSFGKNFFINQEHMRVIAAKQKDEKIVIFAKFKGEPDHPVLND